MILRIMLLLLSTLCVICVGQGLRPMDNETYSVVLKVLKGEFDVSVADRTKTQRAALVRVWRNRHQYSLSDDGKSILCNGKIVVKKSDIPDIAKKGFDATKGSNTRKVNIRLREKYSGLSEKAVQRAFHSSRQCQLLRAKFPNRPPLKPITAKQVQERHQIDLLDMTGWKVTHGRVTYKYVLTVQDVFSRYVWLEPLKGKSSHEIARHLEDIYMEHGPPTVLQHDQGCEFKGAVKRLMESMKVKVIQSSPYHPQSQGKVERMHRALRKKILYDLINIERRGVNWVSHLPKYAQVLNEDPKQQLGWMTPFHVYYGRKSNNILLAQSPHPSPATIDDCMANADTLLPSRKQRDLFEKKRNRVRRRAKNATKHCNEKMVQKSSIHL